MTTCLFLALRWALAVVWVAAGAGKVGEVESIASSIRDYGIAPDGLVEPVARLLPAAEVVLGVALAAGVLPEVSGWLALAAFCTFAGAMAWNLARGRTFDCGCALTTDTPISWRLVGRNLVLAAMSAAVAVGPSGGLAVLRGDLHPSAAGPAATALVAIPMILLLIAVTARLLASVQPLHLLPARRPTRAVAASADQGLSIVHVNGRNTNQKDLI